MASCLVVFSTVPDLKTARRLSRILLKERLAACVHIGAAGESYYEWKGKTCRDRERLLMIKTRKSLFARVRKCLLANHPYELPEIIAVPVQNGSGDYLEWIVKQTS